MTNKTKISNSNIFVTGGTGTLGQAFLEYMDQHNWGANVTVYSRDVVRQASMPEYENITVRYVPGDVLDFDGLYKAMAGHDTVVHMAAQKHIPQGETSPTHTYQVNVHGSHNVAMAALQNRVHRCVAISTDKVCNPVNAYGATKLLMERIWNEFAGLGSITSYTACRYGNVIGSTGSVLQLWEHQLEQYGRIQVTDPNMTRFYITGNQAVNLVLMALGSPSGVTIIPSAPGLSTGELAEIVLGAPLTEENSIITGLRPGEKMHECLLSDVELERAAIVDKVYHLLPVGTTVSDPATVPLYSNSAVNSQRLINEIKAWRERA